MCFHASLILIHRASLKDNGKDRELANNQCRTSAGAVTSLLRTYQRDFGDRPVLDPMIVHAALTASVIHLVELQNPDPSAYRKAVRALRLTVNILASMAPSCAYAKIAHDDLRQLATEWEASPACSASFWPLE